MTDKEQELLTDIIEFVKSLGYEQVWEKCPKCNGKKWIGSYNYNGVETCPTCKGTGKVRIQFKLPEGIEEKIARKLYFDFTDYEKGSVADVTWSEAPSSRRYVWLKKAEQILSLIRQDKE